MAKNSQLNKTKCWLINLKCLCANIIRTLLLNPKYMENYKEAPENSLEDQRLGLIEQIANLKTDLYEERDPHKQTTLKSAISKAEHRLDTLEKQMGIVSTYKKAA